MQDKKPFRATLLAMAAVTTLTTTVGTANAAPGLAGSSIPGVDAPGSSIPGSSIPGSSDLGSEFPGSSENTPSENTPAPGDSGLYEGGVQTSEKDAEDQSTITGHVFDDANQNSQHDDDEKGIEGVKVTNGRDVTTTDAEGRYTLPVYDDMNVSVTQPAGWQVPVDEDNFAQFSYVHKPEGSPEGLKFGGLKPTGAVPEFVNFPMAKSQATASDDQHCAVAADTQTYDKKEVEYARKGAPADLMQRTDYAGCGIMLLGDNVGDDLSLNPDLRSLYKDANGPVRALPGNHDQDYDVDSDKDATDTYRAQFGAPYYSYDVGNTHFIALDNIEYKGQKPGGGNGGYFEKVGEQQLEWMKNDLAEVPKDKHVVVYSHAPIVNYKEIITDDAQAFYKVLEGYTNAVTVGGHTHTLETLRAGDKREEWAAAGIESLPVEQIVAGAVSGDWYSGGLTDNGVPHAYTQDAAEPGVYTLTFSGSGDAVKRGGYYTVRNEDQDHQQLIGVNSPAWRDWATKAQAWQDAKKVGPAPEKIDPLAVNQDDLRDGKSYLTSTFFGGSSASEVEMTITGEGAEPRTLEVEHTQPHQGEALNKGWEFTDPITATHNLSNSGNVAQASPHLWRAALPKDLTPGTYQAEVKAVDNFGQTNTQQVTFTVR